MALFQTNNRPQKSQSDWTVCEYSNSFFCFAVAAQQSEQQKYWVITFTFYIYAFSRRFYPKRLTVHSGYTCFISMCVPWESNPQPFALLTQCSTTEPQEHSHEQKGSVLSVCWHWMQLQWSAARERDCCITILAIDFLVLTSTLRHTQINDVAHVLPMFV